MYNISEATLKGRVLNAIMKGQVVTATGVGAATNLAIAGILTTDELVGVWNATNRAEEPASITSAGNIQTVADVTGDTLVVTWV
jgi:hypothetical protein